MMQLIQQILAHPQNFTLQQSHISSFIIIIQHSLVTLGTVTHELAGLEFSLVVVAEQLQLRLETLR